MTSIFTVYGMDTYSRETWDVGAHSSRVDADQVAEALNAIVRGVHKSERRQGGGGIDQRAAGTALGWAGDPKAGGADLLCTQYGVRAYAREPELVLVRAVRGDHFPQALFHTFDAAQAFAYRTLGSRHRTLRMEASARPHPCGSGRDLIWQQWDTVGRAWAEFVWLKDPRRPGANPFHSLTLVATSTGDHFGFRLFTNKRSAMAYAFAHTNAPRVPICPTREEYAAGLSNASNGRGAFVTRVAVHGARSSAGIR
jgi:hypothetical protein